MTESFTDRAAFMFTIEVDTYDWRASDNTFRINPTWFLMQTAQGQAWLLARCNEQSEARREHLKIAQAQLSAMLAKSESEVKPSGNTN